MRSFRIVAQRIRHLPGLDKCERVWNILRKPYHRLLNIRGRGVPIRVGGAADIRMPPEFAGGSWELHEPKTVEVFANWVRERKNPLILDVGSSIGIFSAVALFANSTAEVVAFDPDLASLAAVRRLCQYGQPSRLRLVHCFVADKSSSILKIDGAVRLTEQGLATANVTGDVGTTRYIALSAQLDGSIPIYSLDNLFEDCDFRSRPVLMKCDVEGAELKVLRGFEKTLRQSRPDLILSIHPPALSEYGSSKSEVADFLKQLGYCIKIIGIDHEEHWWCEH